ncbi:hypothetical protein EHP00_578 [Ecytonucleospora hepatopenaei]|uniref:Uncharacterized protein n=1 Tax=Ecytonucleospora hepatopenaei TaxID=646526 RepID=A0A1W0E8C2_9MICR|nr:hypothetical protein EHP00_578 [Ecytonucleospora hepatopenaei]
MSIEKELSISENINNMVTHKIELNTKLTKNDSNHIFQVLNACNNLHQNFDHIEEKLVERTFYEKLIISSIENISKARLKHLEFSLTQLHNNSVVLSLHQLTNSFIAFLCEFGSNCDIQMTLKENFKKLFIKKPFYEDEELIDLIFKHLFYRRKIRNSNFYILSTMYSIEREFKTKQLFITEQIKKQTYQYIIDIYNRYFNFNQKTILNRNKLTKYGDLLLNKINAINGCVYKGFISYTNINEFIFKYMFLSEISQYNENQLFQVLLLKYLDNKNIPECKMFLCIELKWKNIFFEDVQNHYEQFITYEHDVFVDNIKRKKYWYKQPKFSLIEKKNNLLVNIVGNNVKLYLKENNTKNIKNNTFERKKISPFSGRLNKTNNDNLKGKKLNFE